MIKRVSFGAWNDTDWRSAILEEPEVWGVERLGPEAVVLRLVVKTKPAEQFPVMRELRRRLLEAFAAEGIELPDAGRVVWVERDAGSSREAEPQTD